MSKATLGSILFALGFLLVFVLALPQYDGIKNAKAALKTRQQLLDERTAELKNVKDLDRQVKARRSDINKIVVFLPASKQVDQIVSSIQSSASEAGLQLTGLSSGELTSATDIGFKRLFVGIDANGRYPDFVGFLRKLEQNLRLYDVNEIIGSLSTTQAGVLNFTVKLNAYYLK